MEKSADAFRTISEVAENLALPQHVLRFWESRFPQIKPLKRAGGRRYYRPGDVDLLRAIRRLLYDDGYTIKGVQRLLKERGVRAVGLAQSDPDGREQHEALDEHSGLEEGRPDKHPVIDSRGTQRERLAAALEVIEECQRLLGALDRRGL